jgi:hypothetical protein
MLNKKSLLIAALLALPLPAIPSRPRNDYTPPGIPGKVRRKKKRKLARVR